LHYAAQYLTVEIGQILISRHADVNAKDNYGNNVLWRAAFASNGRGEFIKLLLENGASRYEKNNTRNKP
jgi:ankyrin repeat protein